MLPLFVLYARDRLAMSAPMALMMLAILQALSYLGGLPGGWLADRKLGVRASTMLGALLLAVAYGSLAIDRAWLFWPALALMVTGHSLFRPGLHVLIAQGTGNDERARGGDFYGTTSPRIWAMRRVRCLASGRMLPTAGLVVCWCCRGLVDRHWPAGASYNQKLANTIEQRPRAAVSSHGNMGAVWLLCSVAVVFWLTAQQASSSLAVFAAMNTAQQITLLGRTMQLGPGHFAALHGLMVIAMLPVFLYLDSRKQTRTGSTMNTLIWGYVGTAGAFALMAAASLRGGDAGRVSGTWLLGCYALLSLAEILLAPLGVSLVTRLAPQHKATQAVGLWFAGSAVGNGLAALLGLCWDHWPHHRYFALLAALSLAAAAALLSRRRHLDWLTALNTSAASQPVVEKRTQTMTPTSNLSLAPAPRRSPYRMPINTQAGVACSWWHCRSCCRACSS